MLLKIYLSNKLRIIHQYWWLWDSFGKKTLSKQKSKTYVSLEEETL